MKDALKEFDKELSKLRSRGAIGLSIFVRQDANTLDCVKEATLGLKLMKKEKTKSMV